MALSPGASVGPYRVLGALGAGGMGEVYRARDTRIGREVALKVLPESYASDPDRLRRFEHEARTVGALSHPNLLVLFDVGTHDGAPYLVSELLEGATLRELLGRGPQPSGDRAVPRRRQGAEGGEHGKRRKHRSGQGPRAV